jgi:hypothetical protein
MHREHWIRFLVPKSFVVVLWASASLHTQTPQGSSATPVKERSQPAGMFDLEAGKRYEKQSRWKEAEQEYLQAGRVGAPSVKKEALAAIERLSAHRSSDEENFESELGKFYEDGRNWKEAEQHYGAAAKDASKPVRDRAMQDVKRVHERRWLEEGFEDFDRWLGYIARVLGGLFVLIVFWRIFKTRRGIQVMPFEASTDDANKLLVFSLSSAREELPGLLAPILATMPGNVVDFLPLIILPGVENEFPDPAEDLEIGEIKLPVANWIRLINRPGIRVLGRWNVGHATGSAQARILRRQFPVRYRESRLIRTSIDSTASAAQDRQLANFGYDVLVKAIFSRRYGP